MTKAQSSVSQFSTCCAALVALVYSAVIVAGQTRNASWLEMPRKQAEQLLADSPWSHTQVDTDVSEMFYSPTRQGAATPGRPTSGSVSSQQSINNNRADRGAINEEVHISYRICFLSARPIRQALAKMVLSSQREPNPELQNQLQSFIDRDFSPYIVIAISVDASDKRFLGAVMQEINSATTGTLKNTTYLERQDGKRLFLSQYLAPISDGLGAKFVFRRSVDGQPFLTPTSGTVRFYSEFDSFKLNMRYKVLDMIFDEKLEY